MKLVAGDAEAEKTVGLVRRKQGEESVVFAFCFTWFKKINVVSLIFPKTSECRSVFSSKEKPIHRRWANEIAYLSFRLTICNKHLHPPN